MKKVRILIISIVVILLLGFAVFGTLYFATDIFKSDKELFYKYANQISLKDFVDLESYNNYLKRIESVPHSNESSVTINLMNQQETINYSAYSEPQNKKATSKITINRDNEDLLTINYLRDNDLYGLQFVDIINQYIVLKNDNLKEFASKLGLGNSDIIPNNIESNKLSEKINYEELNSVYNKYLNIIIEEIPEESYSKIEKENITVGDVSLEASGYQINLSSADLQNIRIKILETAQNDEQVFNLINSLTGENMSYGDYQANINEILQQNSTQVYNENDNIIKIAVYKKGNSAVKLYMLMQSEETIGVSLDKTSNGMIITYNSVSSGYGLTEETNVSITKTINSQDRENWSCILTNKDYSGESQTFNVNIQRIGLLDSNEVAFNVSLYNGNNGIELKSNTNFSQTLEFEQFSEGNYSVINELSQEQLINLTTNLWNMIYNKLQREIIISTISSALSTFNQSQNVVEDSSNAIQSQEKDMFNILFEAYEGTISGTQVITLISQIESSNAGNLEHIVTYTQITPVVSKQYNVSCQKDEEGYINNIIIEEIN